MHNWTFNNTGEEVAGTAGACVLKRCEVRVQEIMVKEGLSCALRRHEDHQGVSSSSTSPPLAPTAVLQGGCTNHLNA
jgi:hypothetical protein